MNKRACEWTLRIAVAVTCAGVGWSLMRWSGPVFSLLFLDLGWSEVSAAHLERGAAFALFACALMVLIPAGLGGANMQAADANHTPVAPHARGFNVAWFAAMFAGVWLLLAALAASRVDTWAPALVAPAHGARYCAAFALAALLLGRVRIAQGLLVAGAVATFAAHGLEALLLRAEFVDYLIGLGWRVSQGAAEGVLLAIGVTDLAAAALLLALFARRARRAAACLPAAVLLGWMAFWGFSTAAVRIVDMGWSNLPEAMIRVANGAVPLTLLLLWRRNPDKRDEP